MGLEGHPVSASDLERYGYCPLSWKLHKDGIDAEGKGIVDGTKKKTRSSQYPSKSIQSRKL